LNELRSIKEGGKNNVEEKKECVDRSSFLQEKKDRTPMKKEKKKRPKKIEIGTSQTLGALELRLCEKGDGSRQKEGGKC